MSDQIEKPKRHLISQSSTSQVVNYGYPYAQKCKFSTKHGDEYAAVWANTLFDQLQFKDSYILGRKQMKRGANRVTDGYQIQTKYFPDHHKTGSKCFHKHTKEFKYSQQIIEVAPEQYDRLVEEFQKHGISARQIQKGRTSFKDCVQARKMFSLKGIYFDFLEGVMTEIIPVTIHGSIVFVIYKYVKKQTDREAYEKAIQKASKSFFTRTLANLVTQQIARLNLKFVHKFIQFFFVNLFMSKSACKHYLTALNPKYLTPTFKHVRGQVSKIITGQLIYSGVLITLVLAEDIIKYKRQRMSKKQFTKNFACEIVGAASGLIAQTYGYCKKSYALGSILGLVTGMAAYSVTKLIANVLVPDDLQVMIEYFENYVKNITQETGSEFYLEKNQINDFIGFMARNKSLNSSFFEEMTAESNKDELIRRLVREQLQLYNDPKNHKTKQSFLTRLLKSIRS